jgi:hypothetical protein
MSHPQIINSLPLTEAEPDKPQKPAEILFSEAKAFMFSLLKMNGVPP